MTAMSSAAGETKVISLFQSQKKIYARSVTGRFANWRVAMVLFTQALFYGLAWLPWNERQAVLFDLTARKFYIFGWVFWPQDVLYLALILIVSAYALFFCDGDCRACVLRLCLPANGLYRNFHVDRGEV